MNAIPPELLTMPNIKSLINPFHARCYNESTAFLGALSALSACAQVAPGKTVDLGHCELYITESRPGILVFRHEEYENVIIIIVDS